MLATDGIPLDYKCASNDLASVVSVASEGTKNGIKTFVIGSPGSESARRSLSQMAQAGGTASEGCSNDGSPRYCHFDMTEEEDFAGALRELGLGSSITDVAVRLASFNAGVETGQIALALLLWPLSRALTGEAATRLRLAPVCSTLIVGAGAYWLVERTLM